MADRSPETPGSTVRSGAAVNGLTCAAFPRYSCGLPAFPLSAPTCAQFSTGAISPPIREGRLTIVRMTPKHLHLALASDARQPRRPRSEQGRRAGRGQARSALTAALLLAATLLLAACGSGGDAGSSPACPLGVGRGMWDLNLPWSEEDAPVGGAAGRLLENPNFGATPEAAGDLEAGIVDERLVEALGAVAREHRVCVDAFKEDRKSTRLNSSH